MNPEPIADYIHNIAAAKQSPLFFLDLKIIRKQLSEFSRLLPDVDLFYSTKTNPHPAILELIAQAGIGFDVATLGEIYLTLKSGASPEKLLYTHPVKTVNEIQIAYELGVRQFTADSLEELSRQAFYAPGAQNYIRLEPCNNASLYDYKRKFGASTQELIAIMENAVARNIPIDGLSFMVGSQSMSCEPWRETLSYVSYLINRFYEVMPSLRTINIGSGFPVAYEFGAVPELHEIAAIVRDFANQIPKDMKLIAEPGRYVAAPATVLATRVVQRVVRSGQNWLYTDANAYSGLIEVIENGGHFPYRITSDRAGPFDTYMVAGKTLDPDDMLGKNIPLSQNIGAGDMLYVHDVGAYSSSFFTDYHSLPRPEIVVYDSEYPHSVSQPVAAIMPSTTP